MKLDLSSIRMKKDYPYMYARISAKRAKLLDSQDYENLLKMQPNEIAKKLEEGAYKQEIDELGADHDGIELVELALTRNLSNTIQHLNDIAPDTVGRVMNVYTRKYDIMTVKRLLRWKQGGEKNSINHLLVPASHFSFKDLEELAEKDFEQIVDTISFPESEADYQEYLEEAETLSEIERALDRAYYDELGMLADEIKSQPFRRFIEDELEHENIMTALRLKKYDMAPEQIRGYLTNGKMSDVVDSIIAAESIDEAINAVNKASMFEGEENQLEDLEHRLEQARLQRALRMLHTEPLGITSILGYLIAKIIEVRNLRMLIRAKETDIQNLETIRKNLVIE